MNERPVRVIIETPQGIVVVFDDNGEQLLLTKVITERTNQFGNPNDFVVKGTRWDHWRKADGSYEKLEPVEFECEEEDVDCGNVNCPVHNG